MSGGWTLFDERGRKKMTGQRGRDGDAANAAHMADAVAAHAATAVSASSTTLVGVATDVQGVLEELDDGIANHLIDAVAAHPASAVSIADALAYYTPIEVETALRDIALGKQWSYIEDFIYAGNSNPLGGYPFVLVTTTVGLGYAIVGNLDHYCIIGGGQGGATDAAGHVGTLQYAPLNKPTMRYRAAFQGQLSTASVRFTSRIGMMNAVNREPDYGCYFRYTDTVNSGKWQFVCRNNNVETVTNSTVAPSTSAWQLLEWSTNASGTTCTPLIDGAAGGMTAISTNIPQAGIAPAASVVFSASLGVGFNAILLDYHRVDLADTARMR